MSIVTIIVNPIIFIPKIDKLTCKKMWEFLNEDLCRVIHENCLIFH